MAYLKPVGKTELELAGVKKREHGITFFVVVAFLVFFCFVFDYLNS